MPFQLISPHHLEMIQSILAMNSSAADDEISSTLADLIEKIREDIPPKRRISTGRYSIVKALGETLYSVLDDPVSFGIARYETPGDPFVRSLGLQLLSLGGVDTKDLNVVKGYFESGAAEKEDWIVRECASGLVRKLTRAFPEEVRHWFNNLVRSPDPNQRRFVSESLRPVVENRWFHQDPNYPLGIIRHLFQESAPYPRTSVGNNLSDWMRVNPEKTWPIVEDLARSGDPNSYWIAYRACRNFVKKEPVQVMRLLGVTEYKYKNRRYALADYR